MRARDQENVQDGQMLASRSRDGFHGRIVFDRLSRDDNPIHSLRSGGAFLETEGLAHGKLRKVERRVGCALQKAMRHPLAMALTRCVCSAFVRAADFFLDLARTPNESFGLSNCHA